MKYTGKISCNNSDGSATGHIGVSFLEHLMMALKTSKSLYVNKFITGFMKKNSSFIGLTFT